MLLIALMLTGCGQIKNFIHSETNADLAEIKAELADLKAKNTKGWWNWKLDEKGWGSWITTKTIAITTTAVAVAASLGYLFWKVNDVGAVASDANRTANAAWSDIGHHVGLTSEAHKPKPAHKVKAQPKVGGGGADKPT